MNSKGKRLASIAISTLLAASLLAGCGKKPNTAATTEGNGTQALKPYQIDWYFVGNGPQPDTAKVEEEINKKITDINATIKMHCFDWGSYTQKMQTMLATNDKVDLMFTANWGSDVYQNVRKGSLVDLTDMIPKYAPHAAQVLSDGFLEGSKINGKNYALPVNKEMAAEEGFEFNKALVDKYNLDITKVQSVEDLEPLLKTIHENEPSVYAIEDTQGSNLPGFECIAESSVAGGFASLPHDSTDDTWIYNVDNPTWLHMVKMQRQFYLAGYTRKDAATITDGNPDRKAGKIFVGLDQLKPGKDAEVSTATGVQWVQQVIGTPVTRTSEMVGAMMGVTKGSKDPARVLMFYDKLYYDVDLINLVDYGIKDVHWVSKGDNVIDFAPATEGGKKSGYNPGTPWMFGDQFKSYLYTNEDPKKWDKFKAFNAAAKPLADVGFMFNDESVKNEVAACTNVSKEFGPAITTGSVDPDTNIPKYKEKLKAAGIDKIIAEVNKQYKAWEATKKK